MFILCNLAALVQISSDRKAFSAGFSVVPKVARNFQWSASDAPYDCFKRAVTNQQSCSTTVHSPRVSAHL